MGIPVKEGGLDAFAYLTKVAGEERIEAIVFAEWSCPFWGPQPDAPPIGKRLTIEEAEPFMRGWSVGGGFGTAEVFPFYAWTATRVFYISEYDGSTGLNSIPRHPVDSTPSLDGGAA